MQGERSGEVVVIFRSMRSDADPAGYARAVAAMDALAAEQPGYRGVTSVRGADGEGITISFWADHAAALAWRDHPEHRAIRDLGRERWYTSYDVAVAVVERSYRWTAA